MRLNCFLIPAVCGAIGALGACDISDDRPPVARIGLSPKLIPERDSFNTDVVLDGSSSDDPIDDAEGLLPLRYDWEVSGDEHRVQAGSLTDAMVTLRFEGFRPAPIALTVTDVDGQTNTASTQLQLTIRE
jgi:hypothetical protein